MLTLAILIVAYLASGTTAVVAADTGRKVLEAITKPLTTALLFFIVGWPSGRFQAIVYLGILLSLGGDVVLLSDASKAFMVGLGLFLLAYASYIVAFIGVGHLSPAVLLFVAVMATATGLLLRRVWQGAAGLRGPVIAYASTISTMVIASWSTNGGTLPASHALLASVGAALLYVSDSSLALNRFSRKIPHVPVLTEGVYWLGQLGIALAAR